MSDWNLQVLLLLSRVVTYEERSGGFGGIVNHADSRRLRGAPDLCITGVSPEEVPRGVMSNVYVLRPITSAPTVDFSHLVMRKMPFHGLQMTAILTASGAGFLIFLLIYEPVHLPVCSLVRR
jgi:hypothetical protein